MGTFLRPLPRYRCHKEVSALQIEILIPNPRGVELHFLDKGYAPHQVSEEWVIRHRPQPGGYLVIYDDGYMSWSPAASFESGYSRLDDIDAPSL